MKQRNWQGQLDGLPVETEVIDARDLKVQTKKLALPAERFRGVELPDRLRIADRRIPINVYLVKNGKRDAARFHAMLT